MAEDTTTQSALFLKTWLELLLHAVVCILTAPYRRTFTLYTWKPLKQMREVDGDRRLFVMRAKQFKEEKYWELQSVQVASSLCTGATLAVISWTKFPHPIWAAEALWFCSLICSIWAVITSIQTRSLLDDLPDKENLNNGMTECDFKRTRKVILRYSRSPGLAHWVMMFLWQFPSMTMSYAWCTFLLGLTVYVCTPFVRYEGWDAHAKIAVIYLSVGSLCFFSYLFSCVFVYAGERDYERSLAERLFETAGIRVSEMLTGEREVPENERSRKRPSLF
ncbi:hypothetical protein GQ43DRAFT_471103 [Delitschia confertaspora ATCC 74209]|uniref:DUF6535 domain-containing protein n=1 Tax=Delitschia confertaspora ATCC 74209 TaxID=1513339 RepID=A0A9P4MT54_9PLEO|nr:hypothetical protein GQ43DRAFT_471103 [Delitschia confertaspora ATCC 74209]